MISTKRLLISIILTIIVSSSVVGAYFVFLTPPTTPPRNMIKVTRYVGALADSETVFFAADVEGLYEQNGISLTQVITGGTTVAIQALAADKTSLSFVWGSLINIVLFESQNPNSTELISIASTGHANPVSVQYLKSSGISKPSDLVGKVVGVNPTGLSFTMFQAFLKQNGLSDKIRIEMIGVPALIPALLSRKVDAIVQFATNFAILSANAKEINEEASMLLLSDYGLPNLGLGIIVQKKLVSDRPDVVKRIVNATMQGMRFCVLEPASCAADFVRINPTFKLNETLQDFGLFINFDLGPPFNNPSRVANLTALQLGWHDQKEVVQLVEFAQEIYNVPAELSPESVYTNQFVEQP
jgi:ABC-type nitrate/sulfonate/bicarbonate transport system substrate-binding protein